MQSASPKQLAFFKASRADSIWAESSDYGDCYTRPLNKRICRDVVTFLDQHSLGWDDCWLDCFVNQRGTVMASDRVVLDAVEILDPSFVKKSYRSFEQNLFASIALPLSQDATQPQHPMITIHRDGQNYGPYDPSQIQEMISSGNLSPDDHAWKEGQDEWKPLRILMGSPSIPPAPPASPASSDPYLEPGVYVGRDRVTLGSTTFATKNIGGVSIEAETVRLFWPILGFFFSMLFLVGLFVQISVDNRHARDQGASGFLFIVFLTIFIWCAVRIFRKKRVYLKIAASGGVQKALESTDGKRIGRIAAEIQKVISAQ